MGFLFNLFTFAITVSYTTTADMPKNFSITIKTPENQFPPTQVPYKSIHVKHTLPNKDDQWNIVAIEPLIPRSERAIRRITVHLCETAVHIHQRNNVRYDDETYCDSDRSMLIYQWMTHSTKSTFEIAGDLGFRWDKSKLIVLTVTYFKEQQSHKYQAGVVLHISTLIPRYYVGTILVGNNQKGTRFSCRSRNYPRLLSAVKPLFTKTAAESWRIYAVRNRNFGRKVVQFVVDSTMYSKENGTDPEIVSSDVFLIPDDHILIECAGVSDFNCRFLIYYTYKNVPNKSSDRDDNTCQSDNNPDLFKLLPSRIGIGMNTMAPQTSSVDGMTIFLLVCLLLFIIWISIIIGCVIMRRIRGLVNFRPEPSTPYSGQGTKSFFATTRTTNQQQQKIAADADHIAQLDIEHMGLMS